MIALQPPALGRTGLALVLVLVLGGGQAVGQSLYYVEPGDPACRVPPTSTAATPKTVPQGATVPGRLHVACGFGQGSYTVTLTSTDPGAAFSPKTFLVNFGRVVGKEAFVVSFATPGVQSISATITSNMGSPAVKGSFVSPAGEFKVVPR